MNPKREVTNLFAMHDHEGPVHPLLVRIVLELDIALESLPFYITPYFNGLCGSAMTVGSETSRGDFGFEFELQDS
jgi:hypothetical protein